MELVTGQVVRSLAGHDKGEFAVIISLENKYVYICDGKRRKLETPKKKKIIHIAPTKTVLSEDARATNRQIIRALAEFRKKAMPET